MEKIFHPLVRPPAMSKILTRIGINLDIIKEYLLPCEAEIKASFMPTGSQKFL